MFFGSLNVISIMFCYDKTKQFVSDSTGGLLLGRNQKE